MRSDSINDLIHTYQLKFAHTRCAESRRFVSPENFVFLPGGLRGPGAILSYRAILAAIVSQNSFVLVFVGGTAQLSRDMLQNGVSHRCACVKLSTKGGIAP